MTVAIDVPDGWAVDPATRRMSVAGRSNATVTFTLRCGDGPVRRARIAADVSVGRRRLGQQAEALVTVRSATSAPGGAS